MDRLPIRIPAGIALCLMLAVTWLAYATALHGGFLFDDFANLPALGASGSVDRWPTFWRYITSGIADPTGRPLTLLTFLIDARDWPADPFPFKRTNLVLHLLNGILLYALLARLGRMLDLKPNRGRTAALFGTAAWLLHPLFVSTTLYIVQREAMLPATCALAGLLIWLHGRDQLAIGRICSGTAWAVIGLGGFTFLGILCKANGALLPMYALLVEWVLGDRAPLRAAQGARTHQWLIRLFCWVPAAALCGYIVWTGARGIVLGGPDSRPWTYGQRLLTEPRVLMDYLGLLWMPRASSTGLFNDQYRASLSLFDPLTTLPALLAVLALIVGAWQIRRRHPAVALVVLFYFAGQWLESTSIPLELYFEHRNYVPALLMFWPLGVWLADPRGLKGFKRALLVALPLMLALMTHARAIVWGDVATQAEVWARVNPDSPRAQANAAQIEVQQGHPAEAIARLTPMLATHPEQAQLALNLIGARCAAGGVHPADIAAAQRALQLTPNTGTLLAHWFDRTLPTAQAETCPGLSLATLERMVDAGLANNKLQAPGPRQDLLYQRGRIALIRHQPDLTLADFESALDLQVRPGMALQSAATLGAAGYPGQGLRMLDHYEHVRDQAMQPSFGMAAVHAWVLARQNYWPTEIARLRHQLELDVAAGSTNTGDLKPTPETHL